jgi:hypothetical protein
MLEWADEDGTHVILYDDGTATVEWCHGSRYFGDINLALAWCEENCSIAPSIRRYVRS